MNGDKTELWLLIKPYLISMNELRIMLPYEPTEKITLTRQRFMNIKGNSGRTRPTPAEMKDMLEIIKSDSAYNNDAVGHFRNVLEKHGNKNFILYYWDVIYPDAEPSSRFCLVIQQLAANSHKSGSEISKAMNTSQSYFSCVNTGINPVTWDFVKSFCNAIEVSTDDFIKLLSPSRKITVARNTLSEYLNECVKLSEKSVSEIASESGFWLSELEGYLFCRRPITSRSVEKLCNACPTIDGKKYFNLLNEGKLLARKKQEKLTKPMISASGRALITNLMKVRTIQLKPVKKHLTASSVNFVTLLYMILINDWEHPDDLKYQILLYLRRLEKEEKSIAKSLRPGFGNTSSEIFNMCLSISGYTLAALSEKTGAAKSFFSVQKTRAKHFPIRLAKMLSLFVDYPVAIPIEEFILSSYSGDEPIIDLSYNELFELLDSCPDSLTFVYEDGLSLTTPDFTTISKQQLYDIFTVIASPEYELSCEAKYNRLIKIFS